jgi:hypothetical protein
MKSIYAHFERDPRYLGILTKLCQIGIVEYIVATFEKSTIYTKGLIESFFKEYFINGLNEDIHTQVLMKHPNNWVEASQCSLEVNNPPLILVLTLLWHLLSLPLHLTP